MKPDGLPALPPPRRRAPLTPSKPDLRATARVTDSAGWAVRKPIAFDAAI